ncbi:MAG: oligosaccharide flippase family protein [Clostridia bacterium]|nr:oligosaccharide flippase family protein [Clostridia bacterium]
MKKTLFIKNTAYLTASSLVLRFAGIVFKVWLAARIGAKGMGLYQLVFSLYLLAAAFATGGIPTAVTRLVAGESALGSRDGVKKILSVAFKANLLISAATAAVLIFGANRLSLFLVGSHDAAASIKTLSLCVFFTGVCSVFKGYFLARRNAAPLTAAGLLEQFSRIFITAVTVAAVYSKGLYAVCAAVFIGDTAAEFIAAAYLFFRYRADRKRLPEGDRRYEKRPIKALFHICAPLSAGKYLNSFLRTAENTLVPKALSVFEGKNALSLFGAIKGMALPVLLFPSVILGAVSTLLIPEMSEAKQRRQSGLVRCAVEEILHAAAVAGFICAAIFAVCGHKIGELLYKSDEVGFLLTALSPIVPLMYADSLCDGLLKGLDQQSFTFRVSVSDSAARIVLIFFFVSRTGIAGFIGIMYLSNLATCALNVRRLIKISGAAADLKRTVIIPVLVAAQASLFSKLILDIFSLSDLVYIILLCCVCLPVYFLALWLLGCMNFISLGRIRPHKKYAAPITGTSLIK